MLKDTINTVQNAVLQQDSMASLMAHCIKYCSFNSKISRIKTKSVSTLCEVLRTVRRCAIVKSKCRSIVYTCVRKCSFSQVSNGNGWPTAQNVSNIHVWVVITAAVCKACTVPPSFTTSSGSSVVVLTKILVVETPVRTPTKTICWNTDLKQQETIPIWCYVLWS